MYFRNDYSELAHPKLLEAITNNAQRRFSGYGTDELTLEAADYIRTLCGQSGAAVYFLAGGTVTNMVAISSQLRPHEAVIAAHSGHINVHETGAIEASGHKILTAEAPCGKLTVPGIEALCRKHCEAATVKPRMVYLSQSTEVGSVYTKAELKAISCFCRTHDLLLYMDGARLASALASAGNDLSLRDIAELCDLFYIGGTKAGALLGEALVICNPQLQKDMPWLIKNRSALLAKGFFTALQFLSLLENEAGQKVQTIEESLYWSLGAKANLAAASVAELFTTKGCKLCFPVKSNQIFVALDERVAKALTQAGVVFETTREDDALICRFVTTYSTTRDEIKALACVLENV